MNQKTVDDNQFKSAMTLPMSTSIAMKKAVIKAFKLETGFKIMLSQFFEWEERDLVYKI